MKSKYVKTGLVLALLVGLGLVAYSLAGRGGEPTELTLSQYLDAVEQGTVDTAVVRDTDRRVDGALRDGTDYVVTYPERYADELVGELRAAEPEIEILIDRRSESRWFEVGLSLAPVIILGGVFLYMLSRMQGIAGRSLNFGRAKTKRFNKDKPSVTFADVAGAEEAVSELREIKDFLENPSRFYAMGARIPKGVLLFGPPGTGKTLLARAVAGEAGVPFFSISGSDFVEMFVGVGASRVRDLFQQAEAEAPAIVFVDEIDAVGRQRGAGLGGGHDEREQTLNQLLVEMDGFDVSTGVIVIAATNRPDILDPALLRPGRFDRHIVVDKPDLVGREEIIRVHAAEKPMADDVSPEVIARRTPGFTGADLANLMNEAALLTARRDRASIGMAEIEEAIDRVIAGPERRSRVMTDREKWTIAYHEAGHALVGHALPGTDPIHKVSIIARGRALGWTLSLPTQDRYLQTRTELRDRLAMLLGGRTAEEVIFADPTTGAADDIERATDIARAMVTEYGMSERLGPQKFASGGDEVFLAREVGRDRGLSAEIDSLIDQEVAELINGAHAEARELLTLHRAVLDRLAAELVEHETVGQAQLLEIFGTVDPTPSTVETAVAAPPTVRDTERDE